MRSLVGVCFLGLLFLEVMCCEGCWKQEREALIALNSQMGNYLSWGNTNDCCQWYGVECNTTTGRVSELELESMDGRTWQVNYSDLISFKELKFLSLYLTQISNCTRTGQVLETISSKLLHLEVLILSAENLTNEILPSLRGFTSLKELVLDGIGLDSDLHFQGLCAILKNLEILDLSNNNFKDTDIASPLSRLSSLKSLSLQGSELTMQSIQNISKLRSLEILELFGNNLNLWPL
ncbi:LRR amino-terminal domain protein, partial [Medicago truncatula]